MDVKIFRINYKSDFILTLNSDAGWMTPFCIKFWTGAPSQAYFVGWDGETYTHCAYDPTEPTKLLVQFDDHHLPIGDLKFQIGYHFTVADFPTSVEDEVINQADVIIEQDGEPAQVMLDFNGETAPEIEFSLPAYANEAQRIANEQERIAAEEQRVSNEQQRISNEEDRISAEESRQEHEQQRIRNEETRIEEFAGLKADAIAATGAANDAATLANEKAALAQQKADYAQAKGDYAKAQGDTALADHERAESDHATAASDHTQASSDHDRAESDHSQAAQDHDRAESDHTRAESDHAAVEVYVDSLGAFDISSYHATGSVLAKYADLTAALGTNGANIPDVLRKGGMSVKFVQSSDNKYVQYRLMSDSFNTTPANWQGVDAEPVAESDNLVKSGGVYKESMSLIDEYSYNVNNYTEENYSLNYSGEFGTSTSNKHIYLPVNEGEKYLVKATDVGLTRIAFATSSDSSSGAPVPFVEGTTYIDIPAGEQQLIIIPQGCTYLLVYNAQNSRPWSVKTVGAVSFINKPVVLADWEPDTDYVIGNQRQNNGHYYRCTTAHTSGSVFNVSDGWAEIDDFVHGGVSLQSVNLSTIEDPIYQTCIKLTGWGTSSSLAPNIGDVVYNSTRHALRIRVTIDGNFKTLPFYDGAIYNYNNELYVWNGSDLIKADKEDNVPLGSAKIMFSSGKVNFNTETNNYEIAGGFGFYINNEYKTVLEQNIHDVRKSAWHILVYKEENGVGTFEVKIRSNLGIHDFIIGYSLWKKFNNTWNIVSFQMLNGVEATIDGRNSDSIVGIDNKMLSYPFSVNGGTVQRAGGSKFADVVIATDYVPIEDDATYYIYGSSTSNTSVCGFYDETKTLISVYDESVSDRKDKFITVSKLDGTIPRTAKYLRAQSYKDINYFVLCDKPIKVENNFEGLTKLPITKLLQKKTNSSGIGADDTARVSISSTYIVPFNGVTLRFKLPPFICAWIYAGDKPYGSSIDFSDSLGWFANGDSVTLSNSDIYFRFLFARSNYWPNVSQSDRVYSDLSVAEIESYIAKGELAIYYNGDIGVVDGNKDCEKYVNAMRRLFTSNNDNNGDLNLMPIFLHVSDIHGDVIRTKRVCEYADYLGSDGLLATGDIVAYRGKDSLDYLKSLADGMNTPVYMCIGNHDCGIQGDNVTAEAQYLNLTKFFIDKYDLSVNALIDYPTYYYKDITSKNIRIIALNSYETGRKTTGGESQCYYTQEQIDWLIATLSSTPSDYGVVLIYHAGESAIQKETGKEDFFQSITSNALSYQTASITGKPIQKIIDAFITKTTLIDTFTETNSSGQTVIIDINADFTNVNSGVEFICHINGHNHIDRVGYYNSTQKQLVLNITCTNSMYGISTKYLANLSDLPRGGVGVTQDSFNVYVIDRINGVVKIARVGSNTNYNGEDRKVLIIPYK